MGAQISTTNNPTTVARGIFNRPGVTVVNAGFNSANYQEATGTFNYGPFGIGSGGILTTGKADWATTSPIADLNVQNGRGPSLAYCGSDSYDAAVLSVDIEVASGFNGVQVEFIFASQEFGGGRPDAIGVFLDGEQFALDPTGNRITASSVYLSPEIGIRRTGDGTNTWSTYTGSSPPLVVGIPAAPGTHSMVFAICDAVDARQDSALFVKAGGCVDCDPEVKINYVTTTTTAASTFTSTATAYAMNSGTVVIGVTADPTTTTTSSEAATTTSSEVSTATSTETSGTSSIEASTVTTDDSTTTAEASTTTTEGASASSETSTVSSDTTATTSSKGSTASTTDSTVSTTTSSADSSVATATSTEDSTTLSTESSTITTAEFSTTSSGALTMTTLTTSRRGPCRAV